VPKPTLRVVYLMDVIIVSHRTDLDGPIDYYARFLAERGDHVQLLAHPLDVYAGKCSTPWG